MWSTFLIWLLAVVLATAGLAGLVLPALPGPPLLFAGRRDLRAASRAGIGATVGLLLGTAVKTALGFAMLGIFLVMRVL